jgi:hypothetical protein
MYRLKHPLGNHPVTIGVRVRALDQATRTRSGSLVRRAA